MVEPNPTYTTITPTIHENVGSETVSTQQALNMFLGYGIQPVYLTGSESDTTNTFFAIQTIEDTILSSITVANSVGSSNLIGPTIVAGTTLRGEISDVGVTSGSVCCYR